MKFRTLLGTTVVWLLLLVCVSLAASKRMQKMAKRPMSDALGADEKLTQYPALDLEDLCKKSKNPKCETIVDNYCYKACTIELCSKYGSIRAMCRLMCEAEDMIPQCLKMGKPKQPQQTLSNPFVQPPPPDSAHYWAQYPPQVPAQSPYTWGPQG